MQKENKIEIELVDNAYIIDDGEMKTAAWYCKNGNKYHCIDATLGRYIREEVDEAYEAGQSCNNKVTVAITVNISK